MSGRDFPGFSLQPTGGLWTFLGAVLVLGLAALNTGNNALVLLLSLALGTFVASGVLSRHVLARLRVQVQLPGEVFAGAPVGLRVRASNTSRWIPAAGVVCRLRGLPGQVILPVITAGAAVDVSLLTALPRRGRVELPPLAVEVRLPLGFFTKIVHWPQPGKFIVYPRRVRGSAPRWTAFSRADQAAVAGHSRVGGEVESLREFHTGDDRRDIHWKQTARQQRLIVMQRRAQAPRDRFLVLDRQVPRCDDEHAIGRFEDLVSEVASAAWSQLRRGGRVGLVVGSTVVPAATGMAHARRLMAHLALVDAAAPGDDPLPPALAGEPVYRVAGIS